MYRYDEFDHAFVADRVAQFRDQVTRRLSGALAEDAFKPLRLMNGVYLQLHAYMLRVAIPYGTLNSNQMRMLAHIARKYDRGYGHFTTRQNIQYNWPKLSDTPDILAELASVEMHAIQTSGNCIRNVTADHFAGAAADEVADPRPYAEILRQWSSVHPEFSFLPRKFKIAVTGAERDRAAIQVHDIGLHLKKNAKGEIGFAVYVGGGQGRTPMIAKKIRDFLPEEDLLSYTTAIMRVYNLHGRRDNKYKARIKILVHETGVENLTGQVEQEFLQLKNTELKLPDADIQAITSYFAPPPLTDRPEGWANLAGWKKADPDFARWVQQNVQPHKHPDYGMVTVSLKPIGGIPGDASDSQMDLGDEVEQPRHIQQAENGVGHRFQRRDIFARPGEKLAAENPEQEDQQNRHLEVVRVRRTVARAEKVEAQRKENAGANHAEDLEIRHRLVVEHAVELPQPRQSHEPDQRKVAERVARDHRAQEHRPERDRADQAPQENRAFAARRRRRHEGDRRQRVRWRNGGISLDHERQPASKKGWPIASCKRGRA